MPSEPRVIRASEVGEYAYCHRAWWLHRVGGIESAHRAQLARGVAQHAAHGRAVQRAGMFSRAAMILFLLALCFAIALALSLGAPR